MPINFLNLQGSGGGSAVPFDRSASSKYDSNAHANPKDSLRLARYEEHWRFYTGQQWAFQSDPGEPVITANYCRTIVNKKASWLVGKGMSTSVPEALEAHTKPVLEEVWEYNGGISLLLRLAICGGVTGDNDVIVTVEEPTDHQRTLNPHTKGKIRIRHVLPHQVFPELDPLNQEKLLSVKIVTETSIDAPQGNHNPGFAPTTWGDRHKVTTAPLAATVRKKKYIEILYPDRIEEGWEGEPPTVRPNSLGEIPFVHWANEPFPGEYHGLSDLDGIIDIQREYNEKLTDVSDIINYHAGPVTVITGGKAKSLEIGSKNLWSGLPADAKVFTLALNSDLAASQNHLKTVMQIMMDISGLPEGSLGRIQPISNTSAAALQIQFQPLVEATERKSPGYERGIEKINYFILRWNEVLENEPIPTDLCKHCGGRILEFPYTRKDGRQAIRRQCFVIDPQTLDFMDPDDMKVNVKRKFSFGEETRMMKYGQAKKEFLKQSPSYWDPAPTVDVQKQLEAQTEMAEEREEEMQQQEYDREEESAATEHERQLELKKPSPSEGEE